MIVPAFATPSLSLGPATVSGTTVTFSVRLAGAQNSSISGLDFYIINPNAFALNIATRGAALPASKGFNVSATDSVVRVTIIGLGDATPISDGIIAQVTFDIIAAATSDNESFVINQLYISATDSNSMPVTITGTGTPAPPTHQLIVSLSGNGSGNVNSEPSGIACTGGSCSANYYAGSSVTLRPSASITSSFGSWSGNCAGSGNCTVSMTTNRTAAATFVLNNTVRIGTTYFGSLSGAYGKASNNFIVQAIGTTFYENLDLNRGITVKLEGGYETTFKTRPGYSTIDGTLTISSGNLVADRLILQ